MAHSSEKGMEFIERNRMSRAHGTSMLDTEVGRRNVIIDYQGEAFCVRCI